jgi:hypothetical protein
LIFTNLAWISSLLAASEPLVMVTFLVMSVQLCILLKVGLNY